LDYRIKRLYYVSSLIDGMALARNVVDAELLRIGERVLLLGVDAQTFMHTTIAVA